MVWDKRRKERLAKYGDKYVMLGKVHDPCVYCSGPSSGWDHVPPLCMLDKQKYDGPLTLVRCCKSCNTKLSSLHATTVLERRLHLQAKKLMPRGKFRRKRLKLSKEEYLKLKRAKT